MIIDDEDSVIELIERITTFLWRIFSAVTVIFFLLAGFKFLTAGGDPENFNAAKRMFMYGVIGLAIALLAAGMEELTRSILTGDPEDI